MNEAIKNLRNIKVQINIRALKSELEKVKSQYKLELKKLSKLNWQYMDTTEFELDVFLSVLINEYPEMVDYIGSVLTGKIDITNEMVIDYLIAISQDTSLREGLKCYKRINRCIEAITYYENRLKNNVFNTAYTLNIFVERTVGIIDRTKIKNIDKDYISKILVSNLESKKFSFKELYYKAILKDLGIEYKEGKKGLLTDELTQSEEIEFIPLLITGYINSKLIDRLIEFQSDNLSNYQGYIFEKILNEISELIDNLRKQGYKEYYLTNYEIYMVKG